MDKIIFEDSDGRKGMRAPSQGFIMNFLFKKGIVKAESSANVLMLIVSLIFLALAGYVVYTTFFYQPKVQMSPLQQKIQEYTKQGMNPLEAMRKARNDLKPVAPTSTESTGVNTNLSASSSTK